MIKTEAQSLGFSHIGFSTAVPLSDFPLYENWLAYGNAADMHYLSRDDAIQKRRDPKLILNSARSILSLAMPYPSHQIEMPGSGSGLIASYAWETDYHFRIPPKLELLAKKIQELIPDQTLEYRTHTDTGPLLERSIAKNGGIGWIGKNSCLLIPGAGSYFFLAEILINIDFAADAPFNLDLCGTCSRCVDSCPTGCILPDRTIDSRRCISYLTIENRAGIAPDLREPIGAWMFGCDVCQQVCPWNIRFAEILSQNTFDLSATIKNFDPKKILIMEQDQFKAIFRDSPLYRAKLRGLKRNIIVAYAKIMQLEDLEYMEEILSYESDDMLSELLKWAINRIKKSQLP